MKYLMIALLIVVAGCDTPTRSRFPSSSSSNALGTPPGTGTLTPVPVVPVVPGTPTTPTTPVTTPGFENCANMGISLMYDPYATCVEKQTNPSAPCPSRVSLCKSSLNETMVRFTTTVSNTTNRYCIIPTYKDTAGNSTYLGDPQCTYVNANQVYNGSVIKNRNGFTQLPVTGLMVMFEGMLVEYYACMDSYSKYIQYYCPAQPTYAPCVQGASNYRAQICNQFKTKYSNFYLDLTR